jgi:hypothetical protein
VNSPRADKLRALLAELEGMEESTDRDRLLRETRTRIAELEAGAATGIDWDAPGDARRGFEHERAPDDSSPIEFLS